MRCVVVIALASLLWVTGCKDELPPPAPELVEEPAAVEEELPEWKKIRQVFGLPVPPEVQYVRTGDHFVEIGTSLTVDELEKFFKLRLVDYEFFRSGKRIQIVGLHSVMPKIWVIYRAPMTPIAVRYVEQTGAIARAERLKTPAEEHALGDPVKSKLPDGTLLAPGARYGMPYTPKVGEPLYKEGYRANFGKPFGKWVLN